MTDRDEEIIEVMAEAILDGACPDPVDDAYSSARAALDALRAAGMEVVQEWQPIETAPKDGRHRRLKRNNNGKA